MEIGDGEPLAEQEKTQTWGEMPQVDIPPGQILRITKSLPKLEEVQLNFSTTMVEAEAPEVSEFMAPKLLERARALRSVLDKTIVNYKSKRESKKAAKGEMKEHFDTARTSMENIKNIECQVKGMLELAQAGA